MNGPHDLGGLDGFGPVMKEANEPVFHSPWEKRVFGMFPTLMALRFFNLDELRHAMERMSFASYLTSSYYEHWLHSFETLLVEKGVLTADELSSGKASSPQGPSDSMLTPESANGLARSGASTRIDLDVAASFRVGQSVLAKNIHPMGHTRLPRYARGKVGEVVEDHGVFVFADSHGQGTGASPQHLYGVKFLATELFGDDSPPNDSVTLDLWDDHLIAS